MLSTFGGGSARGFNPGGGPSGEPFQGFTISTSTQGQNYSQSEITGNINGVTTNSGLYSDSGKYSFNITQSGTYRITAKGSRGRTGGKSHPHYGKGGYVQADFSLALDDKITVLLGQEGLVNSQSDQPNAGGGGATFVIINDSVSTVYDPLIVAGGGMGCQPQNTPYSGFAGVADGGWTSSTYYRSNDVYWPSLGASASGWNEAHIWYMGGSGNATNFDQNKLYGGGGCGGTLLDDGADRDDAAGARGRSYVSGALGGTHPDFTNTSGGGYGCGGSSRGWSSGGGGGGWIGGASRNYGTDEDHAANGGYTNLKHGGASYVNSSGTNVTTTQGGNDAPGSFTITQIA